jgi:hypothetical protein
MHDDQATGQQPRVPKDFRRQAIASEQRVASRQEALELKLSTPDVKGQTWEKGSGACLFWAAPRRRGSVDAQGGHGTVCV